MASTTVASNAFVLEVLNQHNYKDWSSRVETYLLSKDLWDVVKEEPPEAENGSAEYKAWRIKNARALHAIKISCGTEMFSFIRDKKKAKHAWEALERMFKSRDMKNKGRQNPRATPTFFIYIYIYMADPWHPEL